MARRRDPGKAWQAGAEAEYVTTKLSLKDVAEKWGVSKQAVSEASRAGGWVAKRAEYRKRVRDEAVKLSLQRDTAEMRVIMSNTMILLGKIEEVLKDPHGLNRYIGVEATGEGTSEMVEKTFERVDTKQLKELADAQKVLMDGVYRIFGIPTQAEEAAQKVAREKLELEKRKQAAEEKKEKEPVVIRLDVPEEYAG